MECIARTYTVVMVFVVLASTAKRSPQPQDVADMVPWLIALVAFIVVGGVVILMVRRWMRSDATGGGSAGFTLQDLRELHARGQLSDEQFASAKAAMVGKLTSSHGPGPGKSSPDTR